jgi:hypothetical protein
MQNAADTTIQEASVIMNSLLNHLSNADFFSFSRIHGVIAQNHLFPAVLQ